MLDKSVPYVDILMRRTAGLPIEEHALPEGYSFCLFRPGDEKNWADIEASVLEFDSAREALEYFEEDRVPYLRELLRRCLFIVSPEGEKVATSTAWWNYTGVRRDPWLHWVAVKPRHQGKGLGKAVVSQGLKLIRDIEGDRDIYLHTQTWSHKAVEIYQKAGFDIVPDRGLGGYANDRYPEALTVLNAARRIYGRNI